MANREFTRTGEKLALLVVFAHLEGNVLELAGTLAQYASAGVRVSLVTAAREESPTMPLPREILQREKSCSCVISGAHRICLLDRSGTLESTDATVMEEQLVRLIREQTPQVIVTCGPENTIDDHDDVLVSQVTSRAFRAAGDARCYPQHLRDGLTAYQPQKLYYSVLPQNLSKKWRQSARGGVPRKQITTVLDISSYVEAKQRMVYCHRTHGVENFAQAMTDQRGQWSEEYFVLADSYLPRKLHRERDLFVGLR